MRRARLPLSLLFVAAGFCARKPTEAFQLRSNRAVSSRRSTGKRRGDMSMGATKVFVAGATGRSGRRIVSQLVGEKVPVKCAVRPSSAEKAKDVLPGKGEVVEMDLGSADAETIAKAMEGCDGVAIALGALETDIFNPLGPYKVDGVMTQRVIEAARKNGGVKHIVLVSSLGAGKFGFPASVLNLFWGVLKFKHDSELALQASGIPYTIIRPGGMEKPEDDFELTHNAKLMPSDSTFGGLVSRLQVAKLAVAAFAESRTEGEGGKVVEVIAETDAPKRAYSDLLAEIPVMKAGDAEGKGGKLLNPLQYYVMRLSGTELAWTSMYNYEKREGVYKCASCGQEMFTSASKFNSGTGWPSFDGPVREEAVKENIEQGLMFNRMEVACSKCGAHEGHLFTDGPRATTGLRYCLNGASLTFEPRPLTEEELAAEERKKETKNRYG